MANPRLPVEKARVTGAADRSPGRHADREVPDSPELGEPSTFLDENGQAAWVSFKKEIPWLTESHRALLEVCCKVRGELIACDDVGVTKLSMYQATLSKLGATPVDETRVGHIPDQEKDEFFDDPPN